MPRISPRVVVMLLVSLYACGGIEVDTDGANVQGLPFQVDAVDAPDFRRLARQNYAVLADRYRREWASRGEDEAGPPWVGLALSGGGIRSAAFSMGVLKGLNEAGVLSDVDAMSGVSGGAYILSWYYLQYHNHIVSEGQPPEDKPSFDDELFRIGGRFQHHVENNARLLRQENIPGTVGYYLGFSGHFLSATALIPAHLLANGIFGTRVNLNPVRHAYERGIRRAFHVQPREVGEGYEKLLTIPLIYTFGITPRVTIPQLRETVDRANLPMFVVNTTANIDDDLGHHGALMTNTVFEFTPFGFGSDAFGYGEAGAYPVDFNRAISISGAAADSATAAGPARKLLLSAFNQDIGYYIPNHHPKASTKAWAFLPFPFYLAKGQRRDATGNAIYLSDGGHSDNLGAFSLVRRLCRTIYVVDAEYDPDFRFWSYQRLKAALRRELGVVLQVPAIDARISEVGRGVLVPFGHEPILKGWIRGFPYERPGGSPEFLELDVVYLKLSIDTCHLEQYSEAIQSYRHRNRKFPQQTTVDQNFSPEQFRVYRELGYHIVKSNLHTLKEHDR